MATIVPFRVARPQAKVRLFCFPFAGAPANVYRTWTQLFPETIDVCPVELPGRGMRQREALLTDMASLKARMLEDLAPFFDELPIAFFGHSMGAKLAFEMSKELGPRVVHLFASAALAPHLVPPRPFSQLPRDEFVAQLRRMGGTPEEILADREFMDLLIPLLRADLGLHERYTAKDDTRAPCAITAIAATADDRVTVEGARSWEAYAGGPFRFVTLDAGHFFLAAHASMIVREVTSDLRSNPALGL